MRTKLASFFLASALCVQSGRADIVLGAPGVPVGSQVATKVPFKNDVTLTNAYKFIFSGIEAKGNTKGAPGSSGTNGNGGQFHVSASIVVTQPGNGSQNQGCSYDDNGNETKLKSGKLTFVNIQDYNTCPLKTIVASPAEVFRAYKTPITIELEWKGEGNAKKPDGVFNILGEYQKNPPAPTGSLNFAVGEWMLQNQGGSQNPDGVVKIVRE